MISIVIFVSGFIESITITTNKNMSEEKEEGTMDKNKELSFSDDGDTMDILILGDSIGSGAGDEEGEDIGRRYVEMLDDKDTMNTINLSQSGSKSIDLVDSINSGEFDEIIKRADLIILSIGGNDLKEILDSSELNLLIDYDNILSKYMNNLEGIITGLKKNNSFAEIIHIGLYNPYGETLNQEKINLLMNWNYESQKLVESYAKMLYIPTYDLFKYNLESYLSIDQFHPSANGYDAITKRLYNVLNGLE